MSPHPHPPPPPPPAYRRQSSYSTALSSCLLASYLPWADWLPCEVTLLNKRSQHKHDSDHSTTQDSSLIVACKTKINRTFNFFFQFSSFFIYILYKSSNKWCNLNQHIYWCIIMIMVYLFMSLTSLCQGHISMKTRNLCCYYCKCLCILLWPKLTSRI